MMSNQSISVLLEAVLYGLANLKKIAAPIRGFIFLIIYLKVLKYALET